MVSGGCSCLENQNHIAAGRCEVANVGYAEFQFASELLPDVVTRIVPIAGAPAFAEQSFDLSRKFKG